MPPLHHSDCIGDIGHHLHRIFYHGSATTNNRENSHSSDHNQQLSGSIGGASRFITTGTNSESREGYSRHISIFYPMDDSREGGNSHKQWKYVVNVMTLKEPGNTMIHWLWVLY